MLSGKGALLAGAALALDPDLLAEPVVQDDLNHGPFRLSSCQRLTESSQLTLIQQSTRFRCLLCTRWPQWLAVWCMHAGWLQSDGKFRVPALVSLNNELLGHVRPNPVPQRGSAASCILYSHA